MSSFAERLNEVFRTAHRRDEPEPRNSAVVAALRETQGVEITATHLGYLRRGKREPSLKVLVALAKHFGVPVGYLAGDDESLVRETQSELELARTVRDNDIQLATRLVGQMSASGREAVISMLNHIVEAEKVQQKPEPGSE